MTLREYWLEFAAMGPVDLDWLFMQANTYLEPVTYTDQEDGLQRWHTLANDWIVTYEWRQDIPYITSVHSA